MHATRVLIATVSLVTLCVACGDGDDTSTSTPVTPVSTSTSTTTTTTTSTTTTVVPTTTGSPATTVAPDIIQPAVWPAADVVLATPEEAAAGFVREVLGVPPVLGEFQAGDARSGEITVLSPGEAGTPAPRGVLLLRRLGPGDGWFVIGAGSDLASISSPATGDEVPAGPVTVEGVGTGFEATLVVRAFAAGDPATELDRQVVMAGNFGDPQPYTTVLDLSAATPGEVVVLMVQGGVGLETDPGNVSAVPVVIRGA